jgi:hypothetical protein
MVFQLSSTAFCFPQWLSALFNGFPIFLNGFPLSEKSEKIYLRWHVYERSLFKLRISRHLLPELCNSRYNDYISPTVASWRAPVPLTPQLVRLPRDGSARWQESSPQTLLFPSLPHGDVAPQRVPVPPMPQLIRLPRGGVAHW